MQGITVQSSYHHSLAQGRKVQSSFHSPVQSIKIQSSFYSLVQSIKVHTIIYSSSEYKIKKYKEINISSADEKIFKSISR